MYSQFMMHGQKNIKLCFGLLEPSSGCIKEGVALSCKFIKYLIKKLC